MTLRGYVFVYIYIHIIHTFLICVYLCICYKDLCIMQIFNYISVCICISYVLHGYWSLWDSGRLDKVRLPAEVPTKRESLAEY